MPRCLAIVSVAVLFASCAAPRIDGTSVETANDSMRAVRHSAGAAREKEFDRALMFVMSDGGSAVPRVGDPAVRQRIHGKTADEVIASAAALEQEVKKRAHEQEVQRQLAELKGSFGRIEAADPKIKLSPAPEPEQEKRVDPMSEYAIYSEKPLTDDPMILAMCSQRNSEGVMQRQCEQDELKSKQKIIKALPQGVTQEVGSKIRVYCAKKWRETYRGRERCEINTVKMWFILQKHPEALDMLPPGEREGLEVFLPGKS